MKKKKDSSIIFAQNIDYGYTLERGGSNEYPQSMFFSKNKKNRYSLVNSSFTVFKMFLFLVHLFLLYYKKSGV